MRQPVFFFRSWAYGYYEARDPISEAGAEAIFERAAIGEGFAVLVGDPNWPTMIIDYVVNADEKKSYQICYFDGRLRTWLLYAFRQIQDDRLFLSRMGEANYSDDRLEADIDIGQLFDEEGLIRFNRKRRGENFRDTWKDRLITLEYHYEPLPAFGEYDSILRVQRDRPWQEQESWPQIRDEFMDGQIDRLASK